MLLEKIVDSIIRNASGGKRSIGSQFDPTYIKNMIHSFRAAKIEADYKKNGSINPVCYQKYYLTYFDAMQQSNNGDNFLLFTLPQVIQLGEEDGIRYIGSIYGSHAFDRIKSRGMLNTLNSNRITAIKNNTRTIYALFDGAARRLEIYNDMELTEGLVEGIFANPGDVPSWNEEKDDYPLNEDAIAELETLVYRDRTLIDKATKPEQDFNIPQITPTAPPKYLPKAE